MNEVNKVGKGIPVRDFSELEYVSKASLLLVCEKIGVKINHAINKKEADDGKGYCSSEKGFT